MKVAVASDDKKTVCGHVGRCNGFQVYEVEDGVIITQEYLTNSFTNHHNKEHNHGSEEGHHHHHHGRGHGHGHGGGHGRLAAALEGCEYLVSAGMGDALQQDLIKHDIKPLITNETDVEEAAIKLSKGLLKHNPDLACR